MFSRQLSPVASKSYFLFGPRQTGKTWFVKNRLADKDLYIDLLPQRAFLGYAQSPGSFRGEVLAHLRRHKRFTCVVDEIQKLPALLDEVHELIESTPVTFVLSGSSARKLRRGSSNLLAGRAYTYRLFPLTFEELGDDFLLDKALNYGTLPPIWARPDEDPREFLRSYTETYLREEIQQEGLVRNLAPFSTFLDIAAAADGEVVNYSNIARECGVSVKTVQQYYQILEETFLVLRLPAWNRSTRTRLVSHPRYFFFDAGVTNSLTHQLSGKLDPIARGRRFEQFVIQQIRSTIEYHRLDCDLSFWRTHQGIEVDLLVTRGQKLLAAAEIKSTSAVSQAHLHGLKAFLEHHPRTPAFVLCPEGRERLAEDKITVLGWRHFITERLPAM
jgi:predicted AAA+ superfamily ATPase